MSHIGVFNVGRLHNTYGCGPILGMLYTSDQGLQEKQWFRISRGYGQWSKDQYQEKYVTYF